MAVKYLTSKCADVSQPFAILYRHSDRVFLGGGWRGGEALKNPMPRMFGLGTKEVPQISGLGGGRFHPKFRH